MVPAQFPHSRQPREVHPSRGCSHVGASGTGGAQFSQACLASPTIVSSNRLFGWLREMDSLRQAIGTAAWACAEAVRGHDRIGAKLDPRLYDER